MKEQRDRSDREHQEELDHYLRSTKELKARIDDQQRHCDEKQVREVSTVFTNRDDVFKLALSMTPIVVVLFAE